MAAKRGTGVAQAASAKIVERHVQGELTLVLPVLDEVTVIPPPVSRHFNQFLTRDRLAALLDLAAAYKAIGRLKPTHGHIEALWRLLDELRAEQIGSRIDVNAGRQGE